MKDVELGELLASIRKFTYASTVMFGKLQEEGFWFRSYRNIGMHLRKIICEGVNFTSFQLAQEMVQ